MNHPLSNTPVATRRTTSPWAPALLCLGLLSTSTASAWAQRLEFFQGPVVSSGRVVGLGGAYIAVAEGADGHLVNPVAFTLRSAHTLDEHFEWDATLSWLNLSGGDLDVDQSGQASTFDHGTFVQGGGNLKFGRHGFGVHIATQSYSLQITPDELRPQAIEYRQGLSALGYAYAFFDGQLLLGGAVSLVQARVGPQSDTDPEDEVRVSGGGVLLGGLWAPTDAPYRLGATLRSQTLGDQLEGQTTVSALPPPERITAPWQIGVGGAYQLGPRPLNLRPTFGDWDPDGARPVRALARRYLLLAADLLLTGPSGDGTIGAQGYLRGLERPTGRRATLSARAGAEAEVIDRWLRVRAGSYYEPSRFEDGGRVHGTAGFDVRVPLVWDWKINGVIDAAADYLNWGLGVGFWH